MVLDAHILQHRVGSNSTKLLILIYFVLQPEEVPQFEDGT